MYLNGQGETALTSGPDRHLRRLRSIGRSSSTPASPFRLVYLNGQGATAHKLEPDRLRRPTEGNGPRAPTFDTSGLQAISSSPRRADLCFEDNAKDYFDRLVVAPSELHKTRRHRRRG